MKIIKYIFAVLYLISFSESDASVADSLKLDAYKIFSFALDGDVSSALKLLEALDTSQLTEKENGFKSKFENRFKFERDNSGYLNNIEQSARPLLDVYSKYWRMALLDDKTNYDTMFALLLISFLNNNFPGSAKLKSTSTEDEINNCLIDYVKSLGYSTTGFGKTGKIFDLLIWNNQNDTTYNFDIYGDTINVNVTFMDNFITLGWEEYATLGVYYPGGWANNKGLFCVRSAYDLQSETFLISYLAHEGTHFKDYKLFPDLKGAELEYRAKLTELSLAKETLYKTIQFFINNGIKGSESPHANANYNVISDLSLLLFNTEFENDIRKWKAVPYDVINISSHELFEKNTKELSAKYKKKD